MPGPFSESKEGIAGYYFIQAASLEEAAKIVKGNPLLDYGHTIEIRPILPETAELQPTQQLRRARLNQAGSSDRYPRAADFCAERTMQASPPRHY